MSGWLSHLRYDPVAPLLASEHVAIRYFVERDLLDHDVGPPERVWELPEVRKIIRKQQPGGSWQAAAGKSEAAWKCRLTETWRQLRFLVDQYALDRQHPAVARACGFGCKR